MITGTLTLDYTTYGIVHALTEKGSDGFDE